MSRSLEATDGIGCRATADAEHGGGDLAVALRTGAEGTSPSGTQKGTAMSKRSIPTFEHVSAAAPTRRTLLKAGAAAIAVGGTGLGTGLARAQDSSTAATAAASPATCVLTAEMTEGPYFLAGDLIRKDITEGVGGVPLQLKIAVQD